MSDYSMITHVLPHSVNVDGKEYTLDTRTCKALQCFLIMDDEDTPESVKTEAILSSMVLNYQFIPVDRIFDVYGKVCEYLNGYPTTEKPSRNLNPILSYEQDHALIVAGFRQAYGISIDVLKSMHWWEFLALLGGLPDDTRLSEIMKVRATPINQKDSPEKRQAIIKAKQSVAIRPKKKKTPQKGVDIISQALEAEGF